MKYIVATYILITSVLSPAFGQQVKNETNKPEVKNRFINGYKEGEWVEFLDNTGKVTSDTTNAISYRIVKYLADEPYGVTKVYDKKTRALKYETYVTDNTVNETEEDAMKMLVQMCSYIGIQKEYYKNGELKFEAPFVDGEINGFLKEYYKNGVLKLQVKFVDGEACDTVKLYDKKGNIKYGTTFKNGKINGGEEYYKNGNIKGTVDLDNNKSVGVIKLYDKNGNRESDVFRLDSIVRDTGWQYYSDGRVSGMVPMKDDKANGVLVTYYNSGKIKSYTPYKMGTLVGVATTFYESGKIKSQILYKDGKVVAAKLLDENGKEIK